MSIRRTVLPPPWEGREFKNPPTNIGLDAIQAQIIARLKSRAQKRATVENFPDRGPRYRNLNNRSVLLVRWDASTYGVLRDVGLTIQERELRWCIIVGARSLGWDYGQEGEFGAYQLIELVRLSLSGYFTQGAARRLYPMTEVFREDQEGTVWWYECIYAHSTVAVQEIKTLPWPLLTQMKMLEKGGQTFTNSASQPYTFDSNDNSIALGQENISAVIVESSDQSIEYVVNTDYTFDNVNGTVSRVATGAILAGATVQISFAYSDVITVIEGGGSAPTLPTN